MKNIFSAFIVLLIVALTVSLFWNPERSQPEAVDAKQTIPKVEPTKPKRCSAYRPKSLSQSQQRLEVDDLPEYLKPIFDASLKNRERIGAVNKLSNDLTATDRDQLYIYLANDENTRFTLWMKDEIMCKLEKQLIRPQEYEQALLGIVRDRQIDGDLRGYAVQHLRSAFDEKNTDKAYIEAALVESLEDRQSDVSGTALLALDAIYKGQDADYTSELETIHRTAQKLALDDNAHLPSRLTALSVILQNPSNITVNIKQLATEIIQPNSPYDTAFKLIAQKILSKKTKNQSSF